jgi:hypothetical protein
VKKAAPPWIDRTDDLSDSESYAAMTPEERFLCFMDVCLMSEAVLSSRPDRRRVLEEREPLSADDEAAWLRLIKESRLAVPAR